MDNFELIHLLRRAARHSREGMEEGRFGMPPPPEGPLPPEGPFKKACRDPPRRRAL